MKLADFLHVDTNFEKLKVTLIIVGWAWSKIGVVKNRQGLSWPIFSVSLTFKCWGTTAVILSQSFEEKFTLGKIEPKIGFFIYSEKFCH